MLLLQLVHVRSSVLLKGWPLSSLTRTANDVAIRGQREQGIHIVQHLCQTLEHEVGQQWRHNNEHNDLPSVQMTKDVQSIFLQPGMQTNCIHYVS